MHVSGIPIQMQSVCREENGEEGHEYRPRRRKKMAVLLKHRAPYIFNVVFLSQAMNSTKVQTNSIRKQVAVAGLTKRGSSTSYLPRQLQKPT